MNFFLPVTSNKGQDKRSDLILSNLLPKRFNSHVFCQKVTNFETPLSYRQSSALLSGFLPSNSCNTQLVDFYDSLALSLNKNIRSDVIYFDFVKAFDSVNHDLILLKLKTLFLIDGFLLQSIKAYLKDRKQAVVVGGPSSTFLPVLSGVPQGSIRGPTLFVLFLNDITLGIDKDTNIVIYAGDTKIWRQ